MSEEAKQESTTMVAYQVCVNPTREKQILLAGSADLDVDCLLQRSWSEEDKIDRMTEALQAEVNRREANGVRVPTEKRELVHLLDTIPQAMKVYYISVKVKC